AGTHGFSVTLKTAGSQSITATDTASSSLTASAAVNVGAAAASTLVVAAPATSTAGKSFDVTVTALDPYGNAATAYTGTIAFTSSDGRATLPANYTFAAADAGAHTFAAGAALVTAGSQGLTAA